MSDLFSGITSSAGRTGDDTSALETVGPEECLLLLATAPVGRIAVIGPNGAPHVVPVNFVLDEGCIFFRSDEGIKLTALADQLVTFQVDMFDAYHRVGWSVMIHGHAAEVRSAPRAIAAWTKPGERVVRLVPTEISGRRITLHSAEHDGRGYL